MSIRKQQRSGVEAARRDASAAGIPAEVCCQHRTPHRTREVDPRILAAPQTVVVVRIGKRSVAGETPPVIHLQKPFREPAGRKSRRGIRTQVASTGRERSARRVVGVVRDVRVDPRVDALAVLPGDLLSQWSRPKYSEIRLTYEPDARGGFFPVGARRSQ